MSKFQHGPYRLFLWGLLSVLASQASGCGPEEAAPPPSLSDSWLGLVVHAPFAGDSTLAAVDGMSLEVNDGLLALPGSDWVPEVADNAAFLIGRYTLDTVRRYDNRDFAAPSWEVSVGPGTNPHGLVHCAGSLFVSRYDPAAGGNEGGDLALFDPADGAFVGQVDLSAYDPHDDGGPEPDALVVDGDRLYVGLQRMDRDASWMPAEQGLVLEIDCAEAEVLASYEVGANPRLAAFPGPQGGLQVIHDEGLQRLDPSTGEVTELFTAEPFPAGTEILGAAGFEGMLVLATEVDMVTNELWCVDLETQERQLLDSFSQRIWGVKSDPMGRVWVLLRDHWASPDVEPGGLGLYDPVGCVAAEEAWVELESDPVGLVFLGQSP